ncbi:DUF11 domain-containing protein [Arthrobacter russicus]|uniref:Repeat protein (TIGR01451 family) n=1 Tax=Arthrobacter russicus TaxID=172040 RepID=A0ABU1JF32_9MICC|nr:DUF11 domain-containing protein [Arthrobacter russicus]MDR6270734.1 putative repeat protein (TIGR01451 family) [Arthrobacter russicus]
MHRLHHIRRAAAVVVAFALAFASLIGLNATSADAAPEPFGKVLSGIYRGDMVMATNSNLLSAGRPSYQKPAQVDGSSDDLCPWAPSGGGGQPAPVYGAAVKAACNNSSSAFLDVPKGAKIVAARLYVMNTLREERPATEVRLAGPGEGYNYRMMNQATPLAPKIRESSTGSYKQNAGGNYGQDIMRQSVWDVTALVQNLGGGMYTVADIPSESYSSWTPWAAWSITAVYEWDNNSTQDFFSLSEQEQYRFSPRSIAWQDGNQYKLGGQRTSVTAGPLVTPDAGQPRFGKTFHQVAHANVGYGDRAELNGVEHGNNNLQGNSAPPVGTVLGRDPACNSTTDVQNETICYLGSKVNSTPDQGSNYQKVPGDGYRPSYGSVSTNSSAYDADIIRIPDAAIPEGTTQATYDVISVADEWLNVGMVGVSINLPAPRPDVQKTVKKIGTGPVKPGDVVEYTLTAKNIGKDVAVDNTLEDQIPAGVTYVPNSAQVTKGFDQGAKSDAADSDSVTLEGRTLVWRPGSSADKYTDPNISAPADWKKAPDGKPDYSLNLDNNDGEQTLTFRATVDADQSGKLIPNQAAFTVKGSKSNIPLTANARTVLAVEPDDGAYTVSKSSDKAQALPGDVITYTVKVTQTGDAPVDASFADDLSKVSGASYVPGSATADSGTVSGVVNWSGNLAMGQTATVTYQMKVDSGFRGKLINTAVPGERGGCDAGNCETTTEVLTPGGYEMAKFADRSEANPGDVVTYSILVNQTGDTPVDASFVDDLSKVVGASYVAGSAEASEGTISPDNLVTWSGKLVKGDSVVVSYQMQVNADFRGKIENVAVPGDPNSCVPGECDTTTTVPVQPRFTLEKTADKTTSVPGDVITYTVNVAQVGEGGVDASFSDELDQVAGATYVPGSLTNVSGIGTTSGEVSWSGRLETGQSATITYQMKVNADIATPGRVFNSAVPGENGDCRTEQSCSVTTEVLTPGSFTVTKSASPGSVAPGDEVTYTVKVVQKGDTPVSASFVDDLSKVAGATYVPGSAQVDGAGIISGEIDWSGTLRKGDVATITYKMKVNADIATPAEVKNTVVPGDKGTCDPADSCTTTTEVLTPGSFTVTKSASPGSVAPGDEVTYTVKVVQKGDTEVSASFADDLSKVAGATFVAGSAAADKGSVAVDNPVNWSGTLAKGDTATVTYKMKVNADLATPGSVKNTVVPGDKGTCDPADSCTTTTEVLTPGSFTVTKSASPGSVAPGDEVTYTVKVVQKGDTPVLASFVDDLSKVAGATFVAGSASADKGSVAVDNPVNWSGTLAKGDTATVTYKMKVNADLATPGSVKNTVVPGDKGTCDPADSCTTTTEVLTPGSFTVTKSASPGSVAPGDEVTYTVKVVQKGDTEVSASFADDLSKVAGATFVAGSASADKGSVAVDNPVNWSGTLAKGDTATVTYKMKVNADLATPGSVKNTVVPGDKGTCDPADSCTTTTEVLTPGGFTVVKTATPGSVAPGDEITYQVVVKQTGDKPAAASFADDLSKVTGATYVAGSATADKGAIEGTVNWSGTLAKGDTVTVTYKMKVNADIATPAEVKNTVVPGPDGGCEPGTCTTTTEVLTPGGFTVLKSVDKQNAAPGDLLTYTVKVTHQGDTEVTASFADDLSKVAGATFVAGSAAADLGTVTGTVNWSGTLTKGQSATVTYQMKVNADIMTPAEVKNTVVPGDKGTCEPGGCETVTPVPTPGSYLIIKSADKQDVAPGDVVTYTVTVSHRGDTPVEASFADDLSKVAGATFVAGSATADKGSLSGTLDWTGTLENGQTATVKYQVKINSDIVTPASVRNVVVPGENGTCTDDSCETTTEVQTPGTFTTVKTVDKSVVAPGDVLTYTVKVTHRGDTEVEASFADDLSKVVGAEYVPGSAKADAGTVIGTLNWSGTLRNGQIATVTYQMKVKSDLTTPSSLKNTVVPGDKGTCDPGGCETTTEVLRPGGFELKKTVSPGTAKPGDLLTFTVKVSQTGDTPVVASFVDDLSKVAGASYVAGSASADKGAVEGTVNWSGTLGKGESATVTYRMAVDAAIADGTQVRNVVVPGGDGTCAPGSCETTTVITVPPKPPVTPEPPVVPPVTEEPLPETGAAVLPWLAGGAALAFAGLAFAVAAGVRRREPSE